MHIRHVSPSSARHRGTSAIRAAVAWLVPALLATGCGDLFGPGSTPQVFVLSSLGGVAVDATENLLVRCMPEIAAQGGEMYFLGDTLLLLASGRGEWRRHQRSVPEDRWQNSDSTREFFYDAVSEFSYLRDGRQMVLLFDRGTSRVRIVRDGALQFDGGLCGTWQFDRAPSAHDTAGTH